MTTQAADTRSGTVYQQYRYLRRCGFPQDEAGALLAYANGITTFKENEERSAIGWQWQDVARLGYLRYLVESGRYSDDMRPTIPRLRMTQPSHLRLVWGIGGVVPMPSPRDW